MSWVTPRVAVPQGGPVIHPEFGALEGPTAPGERVGAACVALDHAQLLVVGGEGPDGATLGDVWIGSVRGVGGTIPLPSAP